MRVKNKNKNKYRAKSRKTVSKISNPERPSSSPRGKLLEKLPSDLSQILEEQSSLVAHYGASFTLRN